MKIIAVDPGYVATGIAMVDGGRWDAKQFTDPWEAWWGVGNYLEYHPNDAILLVEDYRSAGNLTKEAKGTIEIMGMFKLMAPKIWAFELEDVIVRVEQQRLSGQREAAELMGDTIDHLKSNANRKDAFSALSHCVSYRRTLA